MRTPFPAVVFAIVSGLLLAVALLRFKNQTEVKLSTRVAQTIQKQTAIDSWTGADEADDEFLSATTPALSRKTHVLSGRLGWDDVSSALSPYDKNSPVTGSNENSLPPHWAQKFLLDNDRKSRTREEIEIPIHESVWDSQIPVPVYTNPMDYPEVKLGKWEFIKGEAPAYPAKKLTVEDYLSNCGDGSFCRLVANLNSVHLPSSRSPTIAGWHPNSAAADVAMAEVEKFARSNITLADAGGVSDCSVCLGKALASAGPARWLVGRTLERDARAGECAAFCEPSPDALRIRDRRLRRRGAVAAAAGAAGAKPAQAGGAGPARGR